MWVLVVGACGSGPIPNSHSPIPNPHYNNKII